MGPRSPLAMPLLALVVGAWGIALVVGESSEPDGIRGEVGWAAIGIALAIVLVTTARGRARRASEKNEGRG